MTQRRSGSCRILLIGYYGQQNTGDDAMLEGICDLLGSSRAAGIKVLVGDPGSTSRSVATVCELVPKRFFRLLEAMTWANMVVIGGGTHIHDQRPSVRAIWILQKWIIVFLLARLLGRQIVLAGVGIGPIYRRSTRVVGRLAMALCGPTWVRDEQSLECLRQLGKNDGRLGFDLAAALVPPQSTAETVPRYLGMSPLPAFGMYYGNKRADEQLVVSFAEAAVEWLHKDCDHRVRIYEFKGPTGEDDHAICEALHYRLASYGDRVDMVPYCKEPRRTLASVSECSAFIGMRYHACLFAHLSAVPCISIAYHSKVAALVADLGLSRDSVLGLLEVSPERLCQVFDQLRAYPKRFTASREVVGARRERLQRAAEAVFAAAGA